jgi:hypothetical protein
MDFEVSNRLQAERHERTKERRSYRNGYRERLLPTRLGTLELKVPKLREESLFSVVPGAPAATEQALPDGGNSGGVDRRAIDPQDERFGAGAGHDGDFC